MAAIDLPATKLTRITQESVSKVILQVGLAAAEVWLGIPRPVGLINLYEKQRLGIVFNKTKTHNLRQSHEVWNLLSYPFIIVQ